MAYSHTTHDKTKRERERNIECVFRVKWFYAVYILVLHVKLITPFCWCNFSTLSYRIFFSSLSAFSISLLHTTMRWYYWYVVVDFTCVPFETCNQNIFKIVHHHVIHATVMCIIYILFHWFFFFFDELFDVDVRDSVIFT